MAERSNGTALSTAVSQLWWLGVFQAIAAIVFGIAAFFWPASTLITLVYLLSAFVLVYGLIEVARALSSVEVRDTWWMTLIVGLLLVGAGVYLARHPLLSFASFILVVGLTFIAWGIVDRLRAFIDRAPGAHNALDFVTGIAGVAAGIITLMQPVAGGLAFVWVWGLFALITGIMALVFSLEHHRAYVEFKNALDVAAI